MVSVWFWDGFGIVGWFGNGLGVVGGWLGVVCGWSGAGLGLVWESDGGHWDGEILGQILGFHSLLKARIRKHRLVIKRRQCPETLHRVDHCLHRRGMVSAWIWGGVEVVGWFGDGLGFVGGRLGAVWAWCGAGLGLV